MGIALVCVAVAGRAPLAHADAPPETEHLVSLSLRAGAMVTDDQRQVLELDREGGLAELSAGLRPLPWLAGEVSVGGLAVAGRPGVGGLLSAMLALRAMPRIDRLTPWARVAVGVGLTGPLVVPVLEGSAGLWIDVQEEWSVGPELGAVHVIWEDGPTRTSDALFLSFGLAVTFRPWRASPAPPTERVRTRIVHRTAVVERTRVVEELITPPPPPPPSDPEELLRLVDRAVPATVTRSVSSVVPPLLFEHDRAELSSCGEASLYDLLRTIDEAPPDTHLVVEGHADETGEPDHNQALATRRAEAVRDFLVAHGVAPARIELRSRGEDAPLVPASDARSLSLNRRVVVHLERVVSPAVHAEPDASAEAP